MHLIVFDIDGTLVESAAFDGQLYGPWDKKAAEELGYEFVAVGDAVQHSAGVLDLSDHEGIIAQLGV